MREYPFSESQGGGAPCLYQIANSDPPSVFRENPPLTTRIRNEFEDTNFFEALGEEIGPELCRHPGCDRKRIKFSVMCCPHHFEMIKGKPYSGSEAKFPPEERV
jgi:hypothetical protein